MGAKEAIETGEINIANPQGIERVEMQRQWSLLLKERLFDNHGILISDVDGVILRSDSLDKPEYTTPKILETYKRFEQLGGRIGLATARSAYVGQYLRHQGLRLDGPLIFEDGHVVFVKRKKIVLAPEAYKKFVFSLRNQMADEQYFRDTWEEVQLQPQRESGEITICHGNVQWNGDYRASFWYDWRSEKQYGEADNIVRQIITPRIHDIAQTCGLTADDFDVKLSRMKNGLGIIRIAAKIHGRVVSKEMAAELIWNGFDPVFVGDGDGDRGFEKDIQQRKRGIIVALGGSNDLTDEVPEFIEHANIRLDDPREYTQVLNVAMNMKERGTLI
jgi:hypothetical protein